MKTTRILSASSAALLVTSVLLALAPAAKATTFPDLTYTVTLNLSSLSQDDPGAGPFSLDLQLVTGSGAPNVTNTVKLSNFVFTGGSASSTPDYVGGNESGSTTGTVTLTTGTTPVAQEANEYATLLSAGVTQISFNVDQTPNSELVSSGTPIPDEFNVSILDTNLDNVPTTDPSGAPNDTYRLVASPISSSQSTSTVQYFTLVATPEPNSGALSLLAAGGLLGLVLLRRRYTA